PSSDPAMHCSPTRRSSDLARHCREHGKKLRVLWLDAHADFNTNDITPTGNMHGMPVACLIGLGPRELTHLGGEAPAMQVDEMRQDRKSTRLTPVTRSSRMP